MSTTGRAYPTVLNEFDTMRRVVAGESLARYGDGELKMSVNVASIKSQMADPVLSKRLAEILHDSGACMVGIPNIHDVIAHGQQPDATPLALQKRQHWGKFLVYASRLTDRSYVSSFVTRPDSAPWINTDEYWDLLQSLWVGQDVTLVRGSGKSLVGTDLVESGARTVTEIIAPRQHAWGQYEELLERIGRPRRAILCLGPTATVMAVDLCARGVHAIDMGHMGMFLRKHWRGESMWLSKDDKAPEVAA